MLKINLAEYSYNLNEITVVWYLIRFNYQQNDVKLSIFSEQHKALECFLEATHNVASDQFLLDLIQGEGHDPAMYDVMYYLKVSELIKTKLL